MDISRTVRSVPRTAAEAKVLYYKIRLSEVERDCLTGNELQLMAERNLKRLDGTLDAAEYRNIKAKLDLK
jgi:hypothetical protein